MKSEKTSRSKKRTREFEGSTNKGKEKAQKEDVIHTTSGGITLGGLSNQLRKNYVRKISKQSAAGIILMSHMSSGEKANHYPDVTFGKSDEVGVIYPHDDPLVVTMKLATKWVARILIDIGSSSNIFISRSFEKMDLGDVTIKPIHMPMFEFAREVVVPVGSVIFSVVAG